MGFLQALRRLVDAVTHRSKNLPSLLERFLNADTPQKTQRLIEQHPELLSEEADRLLEQLMEAQDQEEWRDFLSVRRAVLARCREVGVAEAFRGVNQTVEISDEMLPLLEEIGQLNSPETMPRRVQLCQQALKHVNRRQYPELWAGLQVALGNSLCQNPLCDRAENLKQAITAYEESAQILRRLGLEGDLSTTLMNQAAAHFTQAELGIEPVANLEQAVTTYEEQVQILRRLGLERHLSQMLMNQANARRILAQLGIEPAANLEQATTDYGESAQILRRLGLERELSQTLMNQASAYFTQAELGIEPPANLEQAITNYSESAQIKRRLGLEYSLSLTLMNQANARCSQARLGIEPAKNLEQAITDYEESAQILRRLGLEGDLSTTLMNQAAAHFTQAELGIEPVANLEQAVITCEEQVQILRRLGLERHLSRMLMNQANARLTQAKLGIEPAKNLEQAITDYEESAQILRRLGLERELSQTLMNQASAYFIQGKLGIEPAANLKQAIVEYRQSLTGFSPEVLPKDCRLAARSLANLLAREQRWSEAIEPYRLALKAAEILYQSNTLLASKATTLSETGDLYRRAAYALAKEGQFSDAVVIMEQGRARGLSEALEQDRVDFSQLAQVAPQLYKQYQEVAVQLRQIQAEERAFTPNQPISNPEDFRQRASQLQMTLTRLLEQIRQVPGYEGFLTLPDLNDLTDAVQPDWPLVYLISTPSGSLALVVSASPESRIESEQGLNITPLWLNDFTDAALLELLQGSPDETEMGGWLGAYDDWKQDLKGNYTNWLNAIDQVTRQLWPLMAPVIEHLQSLQVTQAVLIPTGYLSLLPLHAAWTEASSITGRRYALDAITFTYAPNAQSLTYARQVAQRTTPTSLLAVDEPQPVQAVALSNAQREIETALAALPNHNVLRHEQATRTAVLEALPQHTMLHFSCHGYADFNQPLESGLLMAHDKILTLRDLFDLRLKGIRLAVLSACETGIPGTKLPDEVVSLPTGLLQAGVAGVAASLWSVSDISTMMLMSRFYDLWCREELAPPEALRQAQQWVRDTTNQQKRDYFKHELPEFTGSRMATQTADVLYKAVILSCPEAHDFAHPFHWAAFTYVGV